MSRESNVSIARSHIDAINNRDPDRFVENLSEDYAAFDCGLPDRPERGKAESRATLERFLDALSTIHFDVSLTVAEGDYVVFNWIATGEQTGDLVSPSGNVIPPADDNAVRVSGSTTYEIKAGKITRSWMFWDMSTLSSFYF